jgi:hypothetical protein
LNLIANLSLGEISFFLLTVPGIWTQGLTLAREVFYHLRHTSNSFCFSYFLHMVLWFCLAWLGIQSSYLCFPHNWDDKSSFYWLRWTLQLFLPRLSSNQDPLDFCLQSSWDYRGTALLKEIKSIFPFSSSIFPI